MQRLFYFGVLPALVVQALAAYLYFVVFQDSPYVAIVYSIAKVLIFLWPAIWLLTHHVLPARPQPYLIGQSVWYGALSGVGAALVIILVYRLLQEELVDQSANIVERIRQFGLTDYYLWFALFVSLIHSGLEEYYWRWFIFRGLMIKLGPMMAAVISSAAFASHHYIILSGLLNVPLAIIGTIAVGGIGLLWCWIYFKTNSLVGVWLGHVCGDLAVMGVGYWIVLNSL